MLYDLTTIKLTNNQRTNAKIQNISDSASFCNFLFIFYFYGYFKNHTRHKKAHPHLNMDDELDYFSS